MVIGQEATIKQLFFKPALDLHECIIFAKFIQHQNMS